MSKNIKVNCTSIGYTPEEKHLGVESYGSKNESMSIEEGIMEINVATAVPEMSIPNLSEVQLQKINENFRRRVTEHAIGIKQGRHNDTISR